MPTRLLLVRHGEVDPSWRDRIYGCLDVPLSSAGEEEARTVAARLPATLRIELAVSSGLSRATFGADEIARPRSIPHERDTALREIERGDWAGRTQGELELLQPGAWSAWHASPARSRPPKGESLRDLCDRVLPRLDVWAQRCAGGNVALVSHLWVIRVAVCRALGLSLDRASRLAVPTGELVVLEWPSNECEREELRPTLVGFGTDALPTGSVWFRGPQRSSSR